MTIKKDKWTITYDDSTKNVENLFFDGDSTNILNIFLDYAENVMFKQQEYVINFDKNKKLNDDIKTFYEHYSNI